jgi:hypothetical protein
MSKQFYSRKTGCGKRKRRHISFHAARMAEILRLCLPDVQAQERKACIAGGSPCNASAGLAGQTSGQTVSSSEKPSPIIFQPSNLNLEFAFMTLSFKMAQIGG